MNDNWLEELREGLSDFEMDAPEGLWESLGVEEPTPKASWRRRWIAAAAAIATIIIGSGIIIWLSRTEPLETNGDRYAGTNTNGHIHTHKNNPTDTHKTSPASNETPRLTRSKKATAQNNPKKHKEIPNTHASDEDSSHSIPYTAGMENISTYDQTIHPEDETKTEKENISERQESIYAEIPPKDIKGGSRHNDRFAINVSASGTGNTSQEKSIWMPGIGNDIFCGSTPETAEIHHHMPFRIGLTLQYNVTKRIALESGLVYSAIGSDISVSQDNRTAMGTRSLQYVGIPLNVKFSAWSWRFIGLYISAGATGEKCVSNRFETRYTAEGLSLDAFSRQTEKPLQWSVNAAAGIQLNPVPNISIFAEPGVSYYFNDGTSLETIYKDRPCTFNLNLGLRFTFNP